MMEVRKHNILLFLVETESFQVKTFYFKIRFSAEGKYSSYGNIK